VHQQATLAQVLMRGNHCCSSHTPHDGLGARGRELMGLLRSELDLDGAQPRLRITQMSDHQVCINTPDAQPRERDLHLGLAHGGEQTQTIAYVGA
jgi:hypothetical protein